MKYQSLSKGQVGTVVAELRKAKNTYYKIAPEGNQRGEDSNRGRAEGINEVIIYLERLSNDRNFRKEQLSNRKRIRA